MLYQKAFNYVRRSVMFFLLSLDIYLHNKTLLALASLFWKCQHVLLLVSSYVCYLESIWVRLYRTYQNFLPFSQALVLGQNNNREVIFSFSNCQHSKLHLLMWESSCVLSPSFITPVIMILKSALNWQLLLWQKAISGSSSLFHSLTGSAVLTLITSCFYQ